MTTLITPAIDKKPWPSLGRELCAMIREGLVHGPGDLLGQPAQLDDETEWWIWRAYEVYPRDHPQAGRRRFKRVGLSLRKGTAKTEKAAWIAALEAHPDAPVRCDGWRRVGGGWEPVGRPVVDPYIPMVAYTEEQSEDLAYGALKAILERSPMGDAFDIGEERIRRIDGGGEVIPMASAPQARDGARTTFQHFDETEHFYLPRLRDAHHTMLLNIPKRKAADGWSLETAVAPVPGQGSVAESTMDYARQVASGAVKDSRLFYFHRQASERFQRDDLTADEVTEAVVEASGPYIEYADVPSIVALWQDPEADRAMLAQRWLNLPRRANQQAFELTGWKGSVNTTRIVPRGALITLGFVGVGQCAALVGTEIATGFQWPLDVWYPQPPARELDTSLIDITIDDAFEVYNVWRLYENPWRWETFRAQWQAKYGADKVVDFWTNQHMRMAKACLNFANAVARGEVPHSPSPILTEHIGNARRRYLNERDEAGDRLWVIQKERGDSVHEIVAASAGILSWEARTHALAAGVTAEVEGGWAYEKHGIQFV